jgi:predicted ArsR family transcriptional regulator
MPKAPSPQGARPRRDIRLRVLAALTPEPATATEIAERAGIPGRERAMQATRALEQLEAKGLAFSVIRRTRTRWRTAGDASPQA